MPYQINFQFGREMHVKPLLATGLLWVLLCQYLQAQNCTGGLGDPMVNVTFGSGTGFGPPLGAGITNLQYVTTQCPSDGQYTITNNTSGCFGTWHTLTGDHTGDPNGYFMLINASYQPSDFYVQQVTGLCPGTTYQFAVWVINMMSKTDGIHPNITFRIEQTDGTVLASFQTGDVPRINPATWTQYSTYFTIPPGINSLILRMTNNSPGGTGNDLALDDITFRPAGPRIDISLNGAAASTSKICEGNNQAQQLAATVESCYNTPVFQWQENTGSGWKDIPGAVQLTYSALPTSPGTYLYRIRVSEKDNMNIASCGVASAQATIVVLPLVTPAVSVTASATGICANTPVTFTATPADGGDAPLYEWMVNGVVVSGPPNSNNSYTSNTFRNGDAVSCRLTSNAPCVTNHTAISNAISISVTDNPTTSVQITASATTICSGSMVTFTAIPFNGGNNPSYGWMLNNMPASTNGPAYSSQTLQDHDEIKVIMTSSLYCALPVESNTIRMTVNPMPSILLPSDTLIVANTSIRLHPIITGAISSWQWSPATGLDNPNTIYPVASPRTTTTYHLYLENQYGCNVTAQEIVYVYYDLLLPNGFTPNGDGKNDLFRIPPSVPVKVFRFSVYNRWGGLVFTTTDSKQGWDGSMNGHLLPAGTYIWFIEYEDPASRKKDMKKGIVELIR